MSKRVLLGIFESEEKVVQGAKELKNAGISIWDIFTPYPIHQLESLMELRRSRLPIVCFFAGLVACLFTVGFEVWALAVSWPMNIGGKPFNALPAYIPIAFELTVLTSGLITTGAFLARSKLFPLKNPNSVNLRVTDDQFVIALDTSNPHVSEREAENILKRAGALMIEHQEVNL